jgi:hypothetical protein
MLAPFLSAYDPSDLPGGSIDPLGFERGYLFLADKILPGLTNAAGRPRYFPVICAASLLAPPGTDNERKNARMRADRVLLFERFWAAANVLASERDSELSASGIRGVTYAQTHIKTVDEHNAQSTDANFKMLAHQERYGAIGIYANVAGYLRLLNRSAMTPTQDLGERLGNAFLLETGVPAKLRTIIYNGEGTISVEKLRDWGHAAHVAALVGTIEGECLWEAFVRDPIRSRLAELLTNVPPAGSNEPETSRLRRMGKVAAQHSNDKDLKEAIDTILAFEQCYRLVLLGFGRVLWLCKGEGTISAASVARDSIVQQCSEAIVEASQKFQQTLSEGTTEAFRRDLERLKDVQSFLDNTGAVNKARAFVDTLLDRHTDVQHGKFDRGRRKLPWIERKSDRYELTLSQVGDISGEPKTVEDIRPHEYRLAVADRFTAASRSDAA